MGSSLEELAGKVEKTPNIAKKVTWAVIAVAVLTVVGFLLVGANGPDDPRLSDSSGRNPIEGFGEVAFSIVPAGQAGETARLCALLADRDDTRVQGMRGQRDFRGYDGMIFVFDRDLDGAFVMGGVELPLEIAWFAASGELVSTAIMAPCPDAASTNDCAHAPSGQYRTALEVGAGGLARLGIGPGAKLTYGGPCAPSEG